MLQCFAFCRLPQDTKKPGPGPSILIFLFYSPLGAPHWAQNLP